MSPPTALCRILMVVRRFACPTNWWAHLYHLTKQYARGQLYTRSSNRMVREDGRKRNAGSEVTQTVGKGTDKEVETLRSGLPDGGETGTCLPTPWIHFPVFNQWPSGWRKNFDGRLLNGTIPNSHSAKREKNEEEKV